MSALEVKGLCKRYPAFSLENVSFSVPEGAVMGFIGRNGAGQIHHTEVYSGAGTPGCRGGNGAGQVLPGGGTIY